MIVAEIKEGYKEYIKAKEKIIILENINVKFETGKMYAITGNSGEGKTTLLNIIGTVDNLTNGKALINNKEIIELTENEKAILRMSQIGFVFQNFYLNKNMTVEENIMQPLFINEKYDKNSMKRRTQELIKQLGLNSREKHFPYELSGGEQQRVAIARAIANDPKIILADEPTGNLDSNNERKVLEILKKLSQNGKCVIVVSHSSEVKKYADVVLNLEKGKLEINEI